MSRRKYLDTKQPKVKYIMGDFILIGIICLFAFILIVTQITINQPLSSLPSQSSVDDVKKMHDFLSIGNLAYFSMRTMFRMIVGMMWSILFSVICGVLAIKFKTARRIILPMVNFLESVPLLGFMTFTTAFLLGLYPGNVMGAEALAIFAVFTGQAWNIMLSLYQIMEVVPKDLKEVTSQFRYSAWEKFWRLEFVYSIPGLLWNLVISQSAAWFAIVASEQVTVAIPKSETLILPGIGSYIQVALDRADFKACGFAVIALIINVVILNFLVFQPLVKATYYYRYDEGTTQGNPPKSIVYNLVKASNFGKILMKWIQKIKDFWIFKLPRVWYILRINLIFKYLGKVKKYISIIWYILLGYAVVISAIKLYRFLPHEDFSIIPHLMLLTTLRVVLAMLIAAAIFTPLGVWVASNKRRLSFIQPIGQVVGSIPSNVYTPFIVIFISLGYKQLEWWILPLIMVGCQWYYFFNVIAGYLAIPDDIKEVTKIFPLSKFKWWTRYLIPSMFPYLITAIINAAGAAWNADIAAESLQWGKETINVTGLGQYIAVNDGIKDKSALGTLAMCAVVGLCIIFVWQPLYKYAREKFHY
ncbi:ABC transporter permease subunit [Lactococcus lactis]|uniref:ABC transporter permease subunit n=1 Tax=Lactococcus lactis TaxID=1358 RepID=UPI003A8054E2